MTKKFFSKFKVTKKGALQMVALVSVVTGVVATYKGVLKYFRPDSDEDYDEETFQQDRAELNRMNGVEE